MIWAPALVLMTVVTPSLGVTPLASTYDEAACARDDADAAGVEGEPGNCSEAPPMVAPAIIDCNDPGVSVWVGEMIGSCDMPHPPPPTQVQPSAVHGVRAGPSMRVCDGLHCTHDSPPLRAAPRLDDTANWAVGVRIELAFWPATLPVSSFSPLAVHQAERSRLDRPPRA